MHYLALLPLLIGFTLAASPLPAQGSCSAYQHLFDNVRLVGRGLQTVGVYASFNNAYGFPVVLKYSIGGIKVETDGFHIKRFLRTNLNEGRVLNALNKLALEGRNPFRNTTTHSNAKTPSSFTMNKLIRWTTDEIPVKKPCSL